MTINSHLKSFAGKSAQYWTPDTSINSNIAYRIAIDYSEASKGITWLDKFADFLATPGSSQITALLVGYWREISRRESSAPIVEALVTAHERLSNLTALFLGDIIMEESEISWITQSDVSPLFEAFPKLEYFGARGGNGLSLGSLRHQNLKSLVVQSGGLGSRVVHEVTYSHLPNLSHLELWLGSQHYGWDGTIDDVLPLLSGDKFPLLKYLGLRDSEIADEIAVAVAQSPLLEHLEVLDLSLGTLGDQGALTLINSAAIRRLKLLDLHHHYCTDEVIEKLEAIGIPVDVSDQQVADDEDDDGEWRYVAVSE